ncbi:MAG: hypothetical protein WD645_06260 [Dehalococcoidia bacterium]
MLTGKERTRRIIPDRMTVGLALMALLLTAAGCGGPEGRSAAEVLVDAQNAMADLESYRFEYELRHQDSAALEIAGTGAWQAPDRVRMSPMPGVELLAVGGDVFMRASGGSWTQPGPQDLYVRPDEVVEVQPSMTWNWPSEKRMVALTVSWGGASGSPN